MIRRVRTLDEVSSRVREKETDGLRARQESRRRLETAMPSPSRARIFAHGGGEFCQVPKFDKLDAKLLKAFFFLICQKKDECQVEMPNSWRCWEMIQ